MRKDYEEGFTCWDCNFEGECEVLNYYSLDAYDNEPDAFCPRCDSDNLTFHYPKEDK